ncbi:hypothetical protein H5410_056003 [Solanum commersonii]|uniref:Uncharacterized protein n=1 Tax=Solanum commersonii TaxID=4109 RepID=A0A9J5WKF3_SOLCO|nr:hypothetical protein H5410_056003 [Solanum commersonii]
MENTRKATRNREYTANFIFFLNVSLHSTVATAPASPRLSLLVQDEDTMSSSMFGSIIDVLDIIVVDSEYVEEIAKAT